MPKRKMPNPNEAVTPSPIEEALKEQERLLAASLRSDTMSGLQSRSEQLKIEHAASLTKAKADLLEAQRRVKVAEQDQTEGIIGKKERMFSVIGGEIIPDPDGDYLFSEALKYAAVKREKREKEGPTYFVQDPATGKFSEVSGPVIIPQPSQPLIYKVDGVTGEVAQLQPGEPIVIKQPPPPSQPQPGWVLVDGKLQEVKPGVPTIIQLAAPTQPATGKSWIMQLDGTLEEYEPGKPIVFKQPAPTQTSPPIAQIIGLDGKPVQLTKEGFDMQIRWIESEAKIKKEERMQDSIVGLLDKLKENVVPGVKALERVAKMREQQTTPQQPAAPQEQVLSLKCKTCNETSTATLRAVQKVGNKFQCAYCGLMNDVVFEPQAPPAGPEGPK